MEAELRDLAHIPGIRAGAIIVASIIAAGLLEWLIRRTVGVMARRTKTALDDLLIEALRRPIFISVVLIGLSLAIAELPVGARTVVGVDSVLETFAVVIWTGATFRIAHAVLETLARRGGGTSIVQPRTIPVFEMLLKVVVVGTAVYFAFLAWQIDLTAWLASAGIIGIAIGFAAKDTLANLFSGIFIVADAPYKLGDFIVLDDELRGRVSKIGIRSTRVLTMDDIEVTVPNAVIASSKIVNETGGPHVRQRVRVAVDCAYGSDIDQVRDVLTRCALDVPDVVAEPAAQVRLVDFGSSGLRFELRVWIVDPALRDIVQDALRCRIYKAFTAAGIEMPYSKHDVYVKELPAAVRGPVS